MIIRKLNAISSTNSYLKELLQQTSLANFTVISTNYQSSGRGQNKNLWHSEDGKNLLFSVLIKFNEFTINKSAYLNFAISIAIYQVLSKYLKNSTIKWPNDIMADNDKICGILIENTVQGTFIKHSIVGIGLNVNQKVFPSNLPNASSLIIKLQREFDSDALLEELLVSIQSLIEKLNNYEYKYLKETYEKALYKRNIFSKFKTSTGDFFIGKIKHVSVNGLIRIELENGDIKEFANKELKFMNFD